MNASHLSNIKLKHIIIETNSSELKKKTKKKKFIHS